MATARGAATRRRKGDGGGGGSTGGDVGSTSSTAPRPEGRDQRTTAPGNPATYALAAVLFAGSLAFTLGNYDVSAARAVCYALIAAYLPSYFDGSQFTAIGRQWPAVMDMRVWRSVASYFPIQLRMEEELDPTEQHIIGAHPHGIMSFNHVATFTCACDFPNRIFPADRRDIIAGVLFRIPLLRDLLLWLGCVDASRPTAEAVLRSGRSMWVLPGGEAEQLQTREGEHCVYLRKRFGFAKLALQHGARLVPTYAFGEVDTYAVSGFASGLRMWLAHTLRVAVTLQWGRWGPVIPRKVPVTVVMGKAINVQPATDPHNVSREQVAALLKEYEGELVRLFNKYKDECGAAGKELRVT